MSTAVMVFWLSFGYALTFRGYGIAWFRSCGGKERGGVFYPFSDGEGLVLFA